jgi:hypothetical protein
MTLSTGTLKREPYPPCAISPRKCQCQCKCQKEKSRPRHTAKPGAKERQRLFSDTDTFAPSGALNVGSRCVTLAFHRKIPTLKHVSKYLPFYSSPDPGRLLVTA